ncbi:hypothetical protein GQ600_27411 [Phytophthora cactorum]|nr:hypothetical protein GQ600_27411 [Phytophthora cactorum]
MNLLERKAYIYEFSASSYSAGIRGETQSRINLLPRHVEVSSRVWIYEVGLESRHIATIAVSTYCLLSRDICRAESLGRLARRYYNVSGTAISVYT